MVDPQKFWYIVCVRTNPLVTVCPQNLPLVPSKKDHGVLMGNYHYHERFLFVCLFLILQQFRYLFHVHFYGLTSGLTFGSL